MQLAKLAFGGETRDDGQIMDMGNKVSRKKEFVPPLTSVVSSGKWEKPKPQAASVETELVVDPDDPHGQIKRRKSVRPPPGPSA